MGKYIPRDSGSMAEAIQRQHEEEQRDERKRRHAARLTGAHTTMPIKDMKMVNRWLAIAKEHDAHMREGGVSWYLLVMLGFNTALRIGDLCTLRVKDVRGRERVRIIAEKTDKMSNIKLQTAAQAAIDRALRGRDAEDYVFQSRQRSRKDGRRKPVSRQRCYDIVKEIAHKAGFEERVGCHTMRKTFAWNFYQTSGDLAELQKVLNHSSQEATIHYLGLDQQKIDQTIDRMPTMV